MCITFSIHTYTHTSFPYVCMYDEEYLSPDERNQGSAALYRIVYIHTTEPGVHGMAWRLFRCVSRFETYKGIGNAKIIPIQDHVVFWARR